MGYYQDFGWTDEQAWGGTPDDYDDEPPDKLCVQCGDLLESGKSGLCDECWAFEYVEPDSD